MRVAQSIVDEAARLYSVKAVETALARRAGDTQLAAALDQTARELFAQVEALRNAL